MDKRDRTQQFFIIYHLYGGIAPLETLSVAGFVFNHVGNFVVASYHFSAVNEEEAESKGQEINERFEYLLDMISLSLQQGLGVEWSSGVRKVGPYGNS